MMNSLCQGRHSISPAIESRPHPLINLSPVWAEGQTWHPRPNDRETLLLFKRKMPTRVSYPRAYRGWRASGAKEEKELGEGRSFLRWLIKHNISIEWKERDFMPHPYFLHQDSPWHDPQDEMAQGLSFAIRPVEVKNRKIKLYLRDEDVLSLLNLPYGNEVDFLELVKQYILQRFQWENWRAPAPPFLDWMISQGKRPLLAQAQLGFRALI